MPTPGPIRKEILSALQSILLPALWEKRVPIGYATPELKFPVGIAVRQLTPTLPRHHAKSVDYPLQAHWPQANLLSSYLPYFGILYKGSMDARILISQPEKQANDQGKGIYAVRLQAPSILIYPPGVARDGGATDYWQDATTPLQEMRSLWASFHPELGELLLHTHIRNAEGERQVSHSLQINDSPVVTLSRLLLQEMPQALGDEQDYAQSVLLSLMLRVEKVLSGNQVKVANTSRSPVPNPQTSNSANQETCRNSAIYIQMHLHEPISLSQIAQHAGLSPAHLNRLFQQYYGVTLMRYVRQQRIAAAQKILRHRTENIAEVAALVGFKRVSAFCEIFKKETGLTPSHYRRSLHRSSHNYVPFSE